MQVDVYDNSQGWHHLVNAYEVEAGMVFVGKTVIHALAPLSGLTLVF